MKIYNSKTRRKETFQPIVPGQCKIYVCGMTVYDYCHIGHARVMVVFDMVTRYLRSRNYEVTYVRNITDIDDNIITRAAENGEHYEQLTHRFIDAMHEDCTALGVLIPDIEPRATGHIDQIIEMINQLISKGFAYVADSGDVYFEVSRFNRYGKLSNRDTEELQAGARVDVDEQKRSPLDFVLWKAAKPGEPKWSSPWGDGRPGWHIECSAMSTHCLGAHFDIHGGGHDLMFPHHENEIAQSECATGQRFVNLWMHNGFVRVDDEKMSKSLGNFFTIREVLESYSPEVLRFFILNSHYRSPINYSTEALDNAREALSRFYIALNKVSSVPLVPEAPPVNGFVERFYAAMDDDFNTPEAIAVLFDVVRELNKADTEQRVADLKTELLYLGGILGLLQGDAEAFLKDQRQGADTGGASALSNDAIEALVKQRTIARQNKDWAESDRIRDELKTGGVVLEDVAGQTSWRRE